HPDLDQVLPRRLNQGVGEFAVEDQTREIGEDELPCHLELSGGVRSTCQVSTKGEVNISDGTKISRAA
ncbi:hypothetical protein XENOCAPTIV_004619, partial [Xenoophorus captivus]